MKIAPPVELSAKPSTLGLLKAGITAIAPVTDVDLYEPVWLTRSAGEPLVITAIGHDIVFKFEVFSLAVQSATEALGTIRSAHLRFAEAFRRLQTEAQSALPDLELPEVLPVPDAMMPWPLDRWQVQVLRRLQWIANPAQMPSWWFDPSKAGQLGPGDVPAGTEHVCLTAEALLFDDGRGSRLLICGGSMPLTLRITSDDQAIDAQVKGSIPATLDEYLIDLALGQSPMIRPRVVAEEGLEPPTPGL